MASEKFTDEIAKAKAEYFRDADKVIEKINQQYGTGREGLMRFLNIKDVDNFSEQNSDQN